jgi:beta-phosphoglucomutase-like phosphatase (HAD superfamily)
VSAAAEIEAIVTRIYDEHGHDDDWGVRVIYRDQMVKHLIEALLAPASGTAGADESARKAWERDVLRQFLEEIPANGEAVDFIAELASAMIATRSVQS